MKEAQVNVDLTTPDEELLLTIEQIGLARFVGRINSGVIPSERGYAAVERFVSSAKERPLLSKLTHLMLDRVDSYVHR